MGKRLLLWPHPTLGEEPLTSPRDHAPPSGLFQVLENPALAPQMVLSQLLGPAWTCPCFLLGPSLLRMNCNSDVLTPGTRGAVCTVPAQVPGAPPSETLSWDGRRATGHRWGAKGWG